MSFSQKFKPHYEPILAQTKNFRKTFQEFEPTLSRYANVTSWKNSEMCMNWFLANTWKTSFWVILASFCPRNIKPIFSNRSLRSVFSLCAPVTSYKKHLGSIYWFLTRLEKSDFGPILTQKPKNKVLPWKVLFCQLYTKFLTVNFS